MKNPPVATSALALVTICAVHCALRGSVAAEVVKPGGAIDIVGVYEYASFNAEEGKNYRGQVEITRLGEYYQLRYDKTGTGVGIRRGDLLAVSYHYQKSNSGGCELFVIEKGASGPVLTGQYTGIPGNGKLGKDRWTFARAVR